VIEEEELMSDRGDLGEDEGLSVDLEVIEEEELMSDGGDQGEDEGLSVDLEVIEEEELMSDAEYEGEDNTLQGSFLPPELIMTIVGMAVHADIRCVQKLSLVSQLFKLSCDSHCKSCESCGSLRLLMSNCQPFHIRPELIHDIFGLDNRCTISVRRMLKIVGRSSGLGIALRSMLQTHHKWWSAWVKIVPYVGPGPNWYKIVSVFWKKK